MESITAIFWDVGGVLLTNGWDRTARRKMVEKFGLDWEDFESRHELLNTAFETGHLGLEDYLDRTVFCCPRDFTRQSVKDCIFSQSQSYPETLSIVSQLARTPKYYLGTLNNESMELNQYRIQRFGLRDYFSVFLSSCFLGVRKPEKAIYNLVLGITQRAPGECVFIDDRPLNLECALMLGIHTVRYQNPGQLKAKLRNLGVEI